MGIVDKDNALWDEFEKYKVSDDEYDFSNASEEDIMKMFEKLDEDDQIMITNKANEVIESMKKTQELLDNN